MTNTTKLQPTSLPPSRLQSNSPLTKFFESKIFWLVLVIILFSLPLVLSLRRPAVTQLPVLGQLQNFQLTNQDGKTFGTKQMAGSVLLVNFIFTRCRDVCALLSKTMSQIQLGLKGTAKSIQLLSITADPDYDRPGVLKAYGEKYVADFSTWNFLTGSKEEIRNLAVNNFKTALESEPSKDASDITPAFEIAHGEHFILIDQIGRIRAYKNIKTQADINQTLKEFAILVNTPPR